MNLEGITLSALTAELEDELLTGKINKIFMPTPASFLFVIRKIASSTNFYVDFAGATPQVSILERLPERPDTPPALCMLLRKLLEEGRITRVSQLELDRVLTLEISCLGSAKHIVQYQLILELTGKNSNLICTESGKIICALRPIGKTQSSWRQILPGLAYTPPPAQSGNNFLTTNSVSILEEMLSLTAKPPLSALITVTTGIGKATASEIFCRAGIPISAMGLTYREQQSLLAALTSVQQEACTALNAAAKVVYALINKRNIMQDITLYKPTTQGITVLTFPSVLAATAYALKLTPQEIPEQEGLREVVTSAMRKAEKKLVLLQQDLAQAERADEQRKRADTLMAYLYQLSKGMSTCSLPDLYNGQLITITLNPALTPIANAQNYYKKYNKAKRALEIIAQQIKATQEHLTYLSSLEVSLTTAVTKGEISEIKAEMQEAELLAAPAKKKGIPHAASQPVKILLPGGATVYIGRNNRQNDFVTMRLATARDLWLHAKDIPGSHVVLKTGLRPPTEEEISQAASLAAYYSKARTSHKVPVDYVVRSHVKKPQGARPGFVIFTGQRTIYVEPHAEIGKF